MIMRTLVSIKKLRIILGYQHLLLMKALHICNTEVITESFVKLMHLLTFSSTLADLK